jgi:hypothetical protein
MKDEVQHRNEEPDLNRPTKKAGSVEAHKVSGSSTAKKEGGSLTYTARYCTVVRQLVFRLGLSM